MAVIFAFATTGGSFSRAFSPGFGASFAPRSGHRAIPVTSLEAFKWVLIQKAKHMTRSKARRRPPIHMVDSEADAITDLAIGAAKRLPQVSEMLLDEIGRATIHSTAQIPGDVVTMHAMVSFIDEGCTKEQSYQLVYPGEADISAGKISILTPVGAGLIGLREGQSILWPDREGRERELKIVKVTQAANSH